MLRELSPEITEHLLRNQFFGRIGCAADGQVLVVPVTYLYDGQAIYGQTHEGTKTRLLRQNPAVCFEVDEVCSPSDWRSVVVHGIYEELAGDERQYIEQRLGPGRVAPRRATANFNETYNHYTTTDDYPPVVDQTIVYRIRILVKTGLSETKDFS